MDCLTRAEEVKVAKGDLSIYFIRDISTRHIFIWCTYVDARLSSIGFWLSKK